ncbi:MAG TPA: hypothetical protein VHK63_03580 [Candidatus Limnocylindria bacterium]|nr:hypothetical protein [Candidatus Limnocylindria bacterium]
MATKREGANAMLDYRLHYAVMATQDRLRPTRHNVITTSRGPRRIFRLASRGSGRATERR